MNPNHTEAEIREFSPEPSTCNDDIYQLLDEQVARLAKKGRQGNWLTVSFFGLMIGSASAWFSSSEDNRRIVADLITDIKASGKDLDLIRSVTVMASQYDKALEMIGNRSKDIEKATISLGIDPRSVTEDGMEREMKEMMGGRGKTVGERDRLLQQKLGSYVQSLEKRTKKSN
jgi:hypothetical protein